MTYTSKFGAAALALGVAAYCASSIRAEEAPPPGGPDSSPTLPSIQDIVSGRASVEGFVPMNFDFRVGVVGDFQEEIETESGKKTQLKTPLVTIDPRSGRTSVRAINFPARIVASSPDGRWVVAIAPSASIEGTSGSSAKEAAVSLNLERGEIALIVEFPVHSNFQAIFAPNESDQVYYCVNEPGVVNQLVHFNLTTRTPSPLNTEGNRFYLYSYSSSPAPSIWVRDPNAVTDYPVLALLDLKSGSPVTSARFPSATDVLGQPGGKAFLTTVREKNMASIAYYSTQDKVLKPVPNLVLSRPTIHWLSDQPAVIVKESQELRDRMIKVDLDTGAVTELFSGPFKIGEWDVSPDNKAVVFTNDTKSEPTVFVLSLDPQQPGMNRIRMHGLTDLRWVGCLYPFSEGGGFLEKLLKF